MVRKIFTRRFKVSSMKIVAKYKSKRKSMTRSFYFKGINDDRLN